MEIRTLARKALLDADNSQAIRRALNHQSRGQEHPWRCGELCMIWDKRKSPNMLEKGRWTEPCQIVMEESRTIVWVTQMNRLLRVTKENIRPVSIREFNRVATFHQSCDETKLQAMAEQLRKQLKERSGIFQFSDLTEVEPPGNQEENGGPQPEEEPHRRDSEAEIPETEPASVNPESSDQPNAELAAEPEEPQGSDLNGERDPNGEENENNESVGDSIDFVNEVYSVSIVEANDANAVTVQDNGTLWPCTEDISIENANFCMFEFDVPHQILVRILRRSLLACRADGPGSKEESC